MVDGPGMGPWEDGGQEGRIKSPDFEGVGQGLGGGGFLWPLLPALLLGGERCPKCVALSLFLVASGARLASLAILAGNTLVHAPATPGML